MNDKTNKSQSRLRRAAYSVEALERRTLLAVLTIAQENQLPGTPEGEWDINGAGDANLQGFATDISVNAGQTVSFKIDDNTGAAYHIDIYRLGYYQGNGARLVQSISTANTIEKNQPNPLTNSATGLIDCGNWTVSASWSVPADATSGVYIAALVFDNNSGASHIPFIVRRDASTSDVVFQTSDTTWQAYNNYGGNSLYEGQPAGRAYKVSYNRPFNTRANHTQDFLFNSEYPMIRFLERNGYEVSYISGMDSDRNGDLIKNHKLFLSVGHDEYWSGNQRAKVEAARDAGTNLAFLSGNEMFWKTRWENSIDGSNTPNRTLVCYKETHAGAKIDPTSAWTGTWRDPRFSPPSDGGRPENGLIGQIFYVNSGTSSIRVPQADGKMRIWRNTSVATLASGATATFPLGTLGYEWDIDIDNGFRPAGVIKLSSSTVTGTEYLLDYGSTYGTATATHNLTLYKAASGALVFGAGTIQWSWGLDNSHDRGSDPADVRMQQGMVNLFADMSVQPTTLMSGLTTATKSTDITGPTVSITSPAQNTTINMGQSITVSGTAADVGGVVGAVEWSSDGGQSWHPATGRGSWSFTWASISGGVAQILVRAVDDSANKGNASTLNLNVNGPVGETIFANAIPSVPADADATATELGVKFRSDIDGFVNGIRFYKGSGNTGTHIGSVWTTGGTLLGRVTFSGETSSGWQFASFATPIAITANSTYVASYYAPAGHYAGDSNYFAGRGAGSGHIKALADGVSGPNGVYQWTTSPAFPTQAWLSANYYVDVFFSSSSAPDTTPPTITARNPAANATNVPTNTNVTATFNEQIQTGANLSFTLKNGAIVVDSVVSYDPATKSATLTPTTALAGTTVYTVTVIARDLANNIMPTATWTFTTTTPDTTPPSVTSVTPTSGSTNVTPNTSVTATFNESVQTGASLIFTLTNNTTSANVPATVSYDAATRTATLTPSATLATSTTFTGSVRATDLAGNPMSAPTTWTFTTGTTLPTETIFGNVVPAVMDSDATASELGTRIRPDVSGVITGVRFYKFSLNTGTHVGSLWSNTGTLLARATFINESASGWQTVNFSTPVSVTAGTTYVVSYHAPVGKYAGDVQYFAGKGAGTGSIKALADGVAGANGVYKWTSTPDFPNTAWESANYYVDVFFTPGATTDNTPPNVSGQTPANNATNVATTTTITGIFSEPIDQSTLVFTLRDAANNPVLGNVSYNSTTRVATFTPSAPLGNNTTYTASLRASDVAGNAMPSPATWSFSTVVGDVTAPSITARTPAAGATNVATNTTVTATFNEDINAATLVFTLTHSNGNAVAGSVSYNAATRVATFTPSAALALGVTYTASVRAADTSGNLMPAASTWTFTTVLPDTTPPVVSSNTPTNGATNVSVSTTATATFNEAINQATLVFTLTNNTTGNPVAGSVSYNATTRVATFTPSAALTQGVTYTASVSASDTAGNAMASPTTWSFTTTPPDLTPPVITSISPDSGSTDVPINTTITATFDEAVQSGSIVFTVTGPGGAVAGSTSYNATTRTATFTPSALLANNTLYSVSVAARDTAGNLMNPPSLWSFRTVAAITSLSMWSNTTVPTTIDSGDSKAAELGVKFRSDVSGYITGIRFYKASANTGSHSGSLWNSGGTRLAQATFQSETATGWQTVTFSTPVAITAGTVYVASYFTSRGHYSEAVNYFTTAANNGTLHFLQNGDSGNNGVYRYGNQSRFPTQSFQSSNYWVDVVFSTTNPAARSAGDLLTPPEQQQSLALSDPTIDVL